MSNSPRDQPARLNPESAQSLKRAFKIGIGAGCLATGLWFVGMLAVFLALLAYLAGGWTLAIGRMVGDSRQFVWPAITAVGFGLFAIAMSRLRKFLVTHKPVDGPSPADSATALPAARKLCFVKWLSIGIAIVAALLAGVDLSQNLARARDAKLLSSPHTGGHRRQSKNNLKQIGLALHNYHQIHKTFPPGAIISETGEPRHSWVTMILPHLDHAPLYKTIDQNRAWNDDVNMPAMRHVLGALLHPGLDDWPYFYDNRTTERPGVTHYAANQHVFGPNRGMRFRDFVDGTSNVFMAGEVPSNFVPWGKPGNWRDLRLGINKSPVGFGSPSKGGAHFLLGDGTVRFITENVDPKILRQLGNPADGETLGEF